MKVGAQHALLRRIVQAARIDTVIDTRLVVDSRTTSSRLAHENNVIGTMNILAACSGKDSTVRKFIFKSSTHYYGSEQDDPAFFTESMRRPHAPRTPLERDIVEAEAAINDFNEKQPDTCVTILRCTNVLGPDVKTSLRGLAELPFVPAILGFDPRLQLVHEDDVANALFHATEHDLPGVFNVAADGVLALSEIAGLLGKPFLPFLPPWGTGLALAPLRRLGVRVPPELMNLLRFGRGVDNRKLKATGFDVPLHDARGGPQARRAPAPQPDPEGRARAVPLRARGRGVPALEPERPGQREPADAAEPGGDRGAAEAARRHRFDAEARAASRRPPEPPQPRRARAVQEPEPPLPALELDDYNELESEEIIALLGSMERHRARGPARARVRGARAAQRAARDRLRARPRASRPLTRNSDCSPGYPLVMGNRRTYTR